MDELNHRERLFVEAYLGQANGNATEAARIACYAHPGVAGSRLLKKVRVRARIDARLNDAALSTNEILARLSDLATTSLDDFITIKPDGRWTVDLRKARKLGRLHTARKIKEGQFGPEVEIINPILALTKLAQYRGILKPAQENDLAEQVADIVRRAAEHKPDRGD